MPNDKSLILNPLSIYSQPLKSYNIDMDLVFPYSTYEKVNHKINCIMCKKKTNYITIGLYDYVIKCKKCDTLYLINDTSNKIKIIGQIKSISFDSQEDSELNKSFISKYLCCIRFNKNKKKKLIL